ncbi:MAG: hypothetical protein DWG76_02395 [Chloroflexi bacterium]|nr:hypothetical protein [Chloroflexota bacterium]
MPRSDTPSIKYLRLQTWAEQRHAWLMPIALLTVCILAYGLLIPWLGFYWDDWPKALFAETIGPGAFVRFAAHRPINGWWYILSLSLLGTSPLRWQLYALFWRWASAVAFWLFLRALWPRRRWLVSAAALLFAVYPGFRQTNIALSYYIHFLALTSFFLSLALMLASMRPSNTARWQNVAAFLLAVLTMLTTDYYYGLELIRPVLLYLALKPASQTSRERLRRTLRLWAPYLLLTTIMFVWRLSLEAPESYASGLTETLGNVSGFSTVLSSALGDLFQGALSAWLQTITALGNINWASRVELLGLLLTLLSAAAAYLFLRFGLPSPKDDEPTDGSRRQILGLGGLALVVANLPFWASGLAIGLNFPANRLTLPMAAASSLLLVGFALFLRAGWPRALFIASLLALAIGLQFHTANAMREDGEHHADFWQQFIWRAPTIEPGTAILSEELPLEFFSDDSLTGAVNLIYPSPFPESSLNNAILYLDLRLGSKLPSLAPDQRIFWEYRLVTFTGSTSRSIIIYYAPPACLRILDPIIDANNPLLTPATRQALPLSRPELAAQAAGIPAQAPGNLLDGRGSESSWCYYFEKADLARQNGDWAQVATLGDVAFSLEDSPNHASERVPFIDGYARVGDYDRALELSLEAIEINSRMSAMLCDTWRRIYASTPENADRVSVLQVIENKLTCNLD